MRWKRYRAEAGLFAWRKGGQVNITVKMNAAGWEMQEPGWWTHPDYGGVCRERGGRWWAWSRAGGKISGHRTVLGAARAAEKRAKEGK